MSEHRLEVADVFRTNEDEFLARWGRVLSRPQRKAFDDIRACRTADLGDVCAWTKDGLILRGAGGRPRIDAAGRSSQSKAIWVISGNDTVVENIEC